MILFQVKMLWVFRINSIVDKWFYSEKQYNDLKRSCHQITYIKFLFHVRIAKTYSDTCWMRHFYCVEKKVGGDLWLTAAGCYRNSRSPFSKVNERCKSVLVESITAFLVLKTYKPTQSPNRKRFLIVYYEELLHQN